MKTYKYKGFTIVQITYAGDKWYNVFKGDLKLNQTRGELITLAQAKQFINKLGE